jgi:hypothetical protein
MHSIPSRYPERVNRTARRRRVTLVSAALALAVASVPLAAPASADTPASWEREDIDVLEAVLVLGGIPLALCVLIALAVYVPAMVRGERVAPGATSPENEWLGGPRRSAGELAGPDTDSTEAGGAGARW